jgi:uncharacterized membrane protein YjdF
MYFSLYWLWWFDMALHFLGGFFVAMLMVSYLADVKTSSKLKNYLIIVGAVSFIGVVWEFSEYLASQTLTNPLYNHLGIRAYFMGSIDDTMNDLLMDILGAFSWLVFFRKN